MASDPETQRAALYNRGNAQPVQPAQGTRGPAPAGLADILERVLDKGIVIAGDIQINLLDIELLTIKIRLLVASVERAQEMGINWWENDPKLTSRAKELEDENEELRSRLERLEEVAGLPAPHEGEEVEVRTRRREVVEEDGEKVAERDERRTEEVEETEETDAKEDHGGGG
jgi:hypothetical protein